MGQVIVIANQKGGVGKTTTAVNLSSYIAATGKSTLLVDLDPQGNSTSGIGIDKKELEASLYEVMLSDVTAEDVVLETQIKNLWILPTEKNLAGAEVELVGETSREFRLKTVLAPILDEYDFIFIDAPPSLSLLTVNGLTAAESVLIPLQCEYFALEGLSELLQTIILVRDNLNKKLYLQGVLLTMYQRTNLSKQVMDDVRSHLGKKVFDTVIPRNVTLGEAPSFGMPIIEYDRACSGALAYSKLAAEVIERNR
ncbi:MAG: AAA family ATPase [Candidatus Hydrogenedentota bacterium]|jgi:chromosome partitioning protein